MRTKTIHYSTMISITLCNIGNEELPTNNGITVVPVGKPYAIHITLSDTFKEIMEQIKGLDWCISTYIGGTNVANVKLKSKNTKLVIRNWQNVEAFVFSNDVQRIVVDVNLVSIPPKCMKDNPVLTTKVSSVLQMCPITYMWKIYTTAHPYIYMFGDDDVKSAYGTMAYNLKLRFEQLDKIADLEQHLQILGTKRRYDNSKQNVINLKRRRDDSKCDKLPSLEPMNGSV